MPKFGGGILCLTRKLDEGIKLETENGTIVISPQKCRSSSQVKLAIKAPTEVIIDRIDTNDVQRFFLKDGEAE